MSEPDERIAGVPRTPNKVLDDFRALFLSACPLLDVRAPVEFAKGAFPNAVNLPLMNDEERHLIGLRYKEQGQDSAIALGAELVPAHVQAVRVEQWQSYIEANLGAHLYCFRGGLRSRIVQHWLEEIGVEITLIEGGYKAMRTFLINEMERLCSVMSFVLIGGRTGNGKTLLLDQLSSRVDLEKLARHRGSSFGALPLEQPSNIDFENATAIELMRLEEQGFTNVFLEDEARLIGRVCLPDTLRLSMSRAPIYNLECDMPQRIRNCFGDYVTDLLDRYQVQLGPDEGFEAYAAHHRGSLARIQKRFGSEHYRQALGLLDDALKEHRLNNNTEGYSEFIKKLLCDYYDPMYDYQLNQKLERVVFTGTAEQILEKHS